MQLSTTGCSRSDSLGSVAKQGQGSPKGDLQQAAVGEDIGPMWLQVTSSLFPPKGLSPGHWCALRGARRGCRTGGGEQVTLEDISTQMVEEDEAG